MLSSTAPLTLQNNSMKEFYPHMPVEETSMMTTCEETSPLIQRLLFESKALWQASQMAQGRVCLPSRRRGFDPWVSKIPWRRKWQPTPVFLPGKSHGQRSLVVCSPWDHKESDTTEHAHTYTHPSKKRVGSHGISVLWRLFLHLFNKMSTLGTDSQCFSNANPFTSHSN